MNETALLEKVNQIFGKDYKHSTFLKTIEDLVVVVEQQQKEIKQYQLQESLLLGRLKKAEEKMFAYNQKTKWQVYEENLSLAQKLALQNGEMSG